jgi:2-polyprenyl-3-methyl-5-hydroxy-6-metoxy-1,4-benzoquinol methylase
MSVVSPITYKSNTRLVDQYKKEEIIDLYKTENIDVTRFFENIKTIDLFECLDTNYRFFYPETIFGDNRFYQDLYQTIPGYYHTNRWEHQKAKALLPKNCSLLEVGCGDGFFLEYTKNVCSFSEGIELNSKAVETARAKSLNVSEQTIQEYAKMNKKKFDVVCCFQVLEHIYDIKSFIKSMTNCLKLNGILIIAVPNNNPYLFKRDKHHFLNLPPHHAGLWNAESLTNMEKAFPLSVKKIMHEPLVELKFWYKAQVNYYSKAKPFAGTLLKLIPRQIYKPILKLLRQRIQGKTIMAVYNVKS